MAMTGGAAYLVKSERTNYGSNSWTTDLYIYVKVISQNVVANTSTIALGMYVYSQYSIAWSDFGTNGTSYIGTATSGANCFTFTNGQSGSGTKWLVEDKQVTVSHNSNGTLTLPIYWHWGVNSPWGQYTGPSGSYNVTLSTIDRVAPTVTFSVSSITANGFKISANSTSTADIWQYSTNGGSTWMTFSTSASTSASVTLSSLSPNTNYTVKVRARRQYNQVYGMLGADAVGHYSLASTVSVSWAFILSAIIDSLYPEIVQSFQKDRLRYERKNRQLYAIVFYVSLFVSAMICLVAKPFILILYGENYLPAVGPLRIVVWYTAFSYLGVARNAWMVCENRQKYLKYLYVSAAALNVVLNLALIPSWGASGAAAASLITQASTTVILPAIIRPLRPNCRLMLDAVLFRGIFPKKNESTARRNWR